MTSLHPSKLLPLLLLSFLTGGCQKQEAKVTTHQMGEHVEIGRLTYIVVESAWRTQLGDGFQAKMPQNRFLVLTLSITNGGSSDAAIPLLELESSSGQKYQELSDSTGVPDSFGIIRKVSPGQTLQGRVAFDVPLSTYRIALPESGETGYDKYAWVEIPLRIDADQVQAPLPGNLPGNDTK